MEKTYNPQDIEQPLYEHWEKQGYFKPNGDESQESFCIMIPPPNVTGSLHMGHAFQQTIMDTMIRYQRMQGKNTLWQVGTDHAGIATQMVVERKIAAEEGKTRHDYGREAFIDKIWEWKAESGGTITRQMRRLGNSVDWERERFTMDEGLSAAVRKVFVQLYNEGLIYKGDYIINWCSRCHTALADDEVEHEAHKGKLWKIRYHLADGSGSITIATTRPETIPGDTAICVHPEDERYQHLVGKTAIVPVLGREIPIIADSYVDREFGTGALKVTPCHDHNDWALGKKHDLEFLQVIDEDGIMKAESGPYAGLKKEDCRTKIVADIEAAGDLLAVEDLDNSVGHCYRCHTVVEPHVSTQWFVATTKMAPAARKAVPELTRILPESWAKTYYHWLDNIRDWCISRQIWWGHRIPVWYCDDCGEMSASRTDLEKCPKCGSTHIHQDEDALDTWFSSALWPFSTMGWPDNTEEMEYFYPTDVLVTGYDIIFFWVARMLIMGMEFMKEIPFEKVFIHGLVRDSQGRKMSKSLGNGIDPLEVIEKYGADTLRFMLITGNTPGNDMRFYWERVEGTRNFANKIWNASRFALMNMEGYDKDAELAPYTLADKWILSRLQDTVKDVTGLLERFELGEAGRAIYDFIWSEVCDWYIEIAKPRLYNKEAAAERATAQHVLATVLVSAMKLLHPYMPFITEEIYQCLPHEAESIMISKWPVADESLVDPEAERGMNAIMDSIKAIRNMRAEVNANPGKKIPAIMLVNEDLREVVAHNDSYIKLLGGIDNLELRPLNGEKPENAMAAVVTGIEVYLPLAGLIDVEKETQRLSKELAAMEKDLQRAGGKLNNAGFLAKAPEDVIAKERAKYEELSGKIEAVKKRMAYLAELK